MGYIEDLTEFEYTHDSALAYRADLPRTINVMAIGWLGDEVPASGSVEAELISAMKHFAVYHYVDSGLLGAHVCEICSAYEDRGEVLVELEGIYYLLPRMVIHYTEAHAYLPPGAFLSALRRFWGSAEAARCRAETCGAEAVPLSGSAVVPDLAQEGREEKIRKKVRELMASGLSRQETERKIREWLRESDSEEPDFF